MTVSNPDTRPYRPCVGVMLVNQDGLIFAGQRNDRPAHEPPAWQMPQGGIDDGEAPEAAALRELWEETGVEADKVTIETQTQDWLPYDLPHDLSLKLWKGKYRGQKQLWFLMRFNGTDSDINIETEVPEFSEWCWMAPDKLIESIVPFKRNLYGKVLGEFGPKL
ncbi:MULTISPECIES: RNA pyrophosphohydrolase [Halocynthiibacter]|uniref:RNA pyrophosphohydrolase n=1 Tax=Halocynthiibacter halioticoli TaxID=2986804 RepID=A0AAE3LQ53_9RHOB|nr:MULTISPECIES: RNA pyrophosphohydrolase [Halocynthiibacter]MCV6823168.1 RNA pyrophosphohydrolase [Halocynthiibacter halioticoli]MCW4056169.1 RNA pyrophosphohydrolase [Halocynthiibacter sp. SDUM655004]